MIRIYLSGRMTIETETGTLGPHAFPGRQGRTAFAYLACHRGSPVSRSALSEVLWPAGPPAAPDPALTAIISKLRSLLTAAGIDGAGSIRAGGGCYELELPGGAWLDQEAAADSIHEAESALKAGDAARAYGPSAVAHHIARRPFLPGEEGPWIEQRREKLAGILLRALECRAEVYLWNREYPLALEAARDAVALQPLRESGYRLLMRAHAAAGNSAEALRVYEECRLQISEELGVSPSRETRAVHARVLEAL